MTVGLYLNPTDLTIKVAAHPTRRQSRDHSQAPVHLLVIWLLVTSQHSSQFLGQIVTSIARRHPRMLPTFRRFIVTTDWTSTLTVTCSLYRSRAEP